MTKKPRNSNKAITIISVIALPILLLGVSLWWTGSGSKLSIQNTMEQYLEDKYDKDFTVEKPKLEGSGLGVSGSYEANAYPNDDTSLVFMVGKTQSTGSNYDSYSRTVWHREELPRVTNFVSRLDPPMKNPHINLSVLIPTAENPDPIRGAVPSVDEAILKYSDEILYDVGIHSSVNNLQDNKTKTDARNQFLSLYNFIKSRGIANPGMSFSISSVEENSGYNCKTSRISHFGSIESLLDDCLSTPSKRGIY